MFTFPGQRPTEKIFMVIRKHVIVYVRILAAFLITVVAPLVIFLTIWFKYYPYSQNPNLGVSIGLFACIYILFGMLLACIAWINEQFDLFIITNERLIDITQVSILRRTVSSTPLKHIQDATSDVSGVFPTILNYGNIEIQTAAGDASVFYMDRIPDPAFVARAILNHVREMRGEKPEKEEDEIGL
jgi:hypothetical protein